MPRIPFKVVFASSEERECPAFELMSERVGAKGWASERFCSWPQCLVLGFNTTCRLERLKLLSHQYKIATRVEIFVGSCGVGQVASSSASADPKKQQPEWLGANFRRVGHVSFSSNSHTSFKARELKSVHLDSIEGQFLKLVFHKVSRQQIPLPFPSVSSLAHVRNSQCHVNSLNVYAQASLIALSVSGEELPSAPISLPVPVAVHAAPPVMLIDSVTASHIERLNLAKERAARDEQFGYADELKRLIDALKEAGAEIATLESEKFAAVRREDYALASKLKADLEQMRAAAYSQLPQLEPADEEQFEFNPREIFSSMPTMDAQEDPMMQGEPTPTAPVPGHRSSPSPIRLPPSVVTVPTTLEAEEPDVVPPEKPISRPKPRSMPSAEPLSQQQQKPEPQPERPVYIDTRPLPTLSRRGKRSQQSTGPTSSLVEEEAPPATTPRDLGPPSPLTGAQQTDAQAAIEAFGEFIVRGLFSSNRTHREIALKELAERLRNPSWVSDVEMPSEEVFRAAIQVIQKTVVDSIPVVYLAGMALLEALNGYAIRNEIQDKIPSEILTTTLSIMVGKLGDGNQRLRESTGNALASLVRGCIGLPPILSALLRVPSAGASWRQWAGRLAVLSALVPAFKLEFDPSSSRFLIAALDNTKEDVRHAAVGCILEYYKIRPGPTRQAIAEMNPPHLELIETAFTRHDNGELGAKGDKPPNRSSTAASPRIGSPRKSPRLASPRESPHKGTAPRPPSGTRKKTPPTLALAPGQSRPRTQEPVEQASSARSTKASAREAKLPRLTPRSEELPTVPARTEARMASAQQTTEEDELLQEDEKHRSPEVSQIQPVEELIGEEPQEGTAGEVPKETGEGEQAEVEEEYKDDFEKEEEEEADQEKAASQPEPARKPETEQFYCSFCGLPLRDEDARGSHYLYECIMLSECPLCGQVIEVACSTEHLLDECDYRQTCHKCTHCLRVLSGSEYTAHASQCHDPPAERCFLCDSVIKAKDESEKMALWADHLTSICPKHIRRPHH